MVTNTRVFTLLLWIFSFFAFVPLAAQTPPSSQPPQIPSVIEAVQEEALLPTLDGPNYEVISGETLELRIRVDNIPGDEATVIFPDLPGGIERVGNPTVLIRSGQTVELRIELRATIPGRWVVEGILVSTAVGAEQIEPIIVSVAERNEDGVVPFRAQWKVLDDTFVQSESFPVFLEIVGANTYFFPEEIEYRAPETGLFEEVGGLGEVETRTIGDLTLYEIPVAAFLFTPATNGSITIPDATIRAGGIIAEAASLNVEVAPFPPGVESSNAIGAYEVRHQVSTQRVEPGGTVVLDIEVEGVGNLPVIDFPDVDVQGLVEIDRSENSDIEPDRQDLRGYVGVRRRTIRYEVDGDAEAGRLVVNRYGQYDPERNVLDYTPATRYDIEIVRSGTVENREALPPSLPLLTVQELTGPVWYHFDQVRWLYYFLLLGPLVFSVSALWSARRSERSRRRRRGSAAILGIVPFLLGFVFFPPIDRDRLEKADRLLREDRPAVAAVLYDLEIDRNDWHAGLHYNRGILSVRLDRPVLATYHLRRAVRLAPERQDFRNALESATDYFGLEDQIPIPRYARPDYFILVLIALWTFFWIILSMHRRLRTTLSLVAVGMIMVVTSGGLVWSWNMDRQLDGVVEEAVHVRRIPDSTAVPWVRLSEAQAVRIELSYDDFYLVRTQMGMTGWVPQKAVRTRPE